MEASTTVVAPVSPTTRHAWLPYTVAGLLLVWMAVAITLAQWRMAPTFDEQNHVTRGIAILRTGDYRLSYHHPPLANILQGLPVAWGTHGFSTDADWWNPGTPNSLSIWDAAATTIWRRAPGRTYDANLAPNGLAVIRLARLPMLLFALGMGVLIFLWARALFGAWGGVLSLALYAFDPNMLAHGGLATTDIPAACTILLAMWLARGYLRAPSRGRLIWAGLGLGLALAAKFSALILLPVLGLLLLIVALAAPRLAGLKLADVWRAHPLVGRVGRALAVCAVAGLIAGVTVWGVYGCWVEALGSKPGQPVAADANLKERLPVPALQYLRGIRTVKSEAGGHRAYLLGETDARGKGWWYYFPVTAAVKTPLPALLCILTILALLLVPRARAALSVPGHEWLILLLPAGVFLLAALGLLGVSLNLGIRHVLPLYPFLLIAAGGLVKLRPEMPAIWRGGALAALIAVQAIGTTTAFPNYLSYFNGLVRPGQGYRVLADSNLDWGQDLGALVAWQRAQGVRHLAISYFGTTPPEAYGLTRQAAPVAPTANQQSYTAQAGFGLMRRDPAGIANYHGWLAISASNLVMPMEANKDAPATNYRRALRDLGVDPDTPDARVGATIFVYRLP